MLSATFRIDWIFIDGIIIVLLFLLLVSVRIFKSTHRWRSSFSNKALQYFIFPQTSEGVNKQFILTKKWSLIRNISLKERSSTRPVIFTLRTNYKRKLLRILTEGLSSYGFNVINVRVKKKHYGTSKILRTVVINEFTSFISSVIDAFKKKELIENPNYVLINHFRSNFPYKAVLSDVKNIGMILINPRVTLENIKNFYDSNDQSHQNNQFFTIFSKKSIFISKNKNQKRFLKDLYSINTNSLKIFSLDKAKKSFKYYETLLLGIIIDIVENKLLNSKM